MDGVDDYCVDFVGCELFQLGYDVFMWVDYDVLYLVGFEYVDVLFFVSGIVGVVVEEE